MGHRDGWNREMRISSVLRWINENLFCLPSYNEVDLFMGLSVFGVKNRIGYELAQFTTYPFLNFCQFHCWRDFVYTEPGPRVFVGQMYVEVFPKEILVPFCLFQNGVDLFGSFQYKR